MQAAIEHNSYDYFSKLYDKDSNTKLDGNTMIKHAIANPIYDYLIDPSLVYCDNKYHELNDDEVNIDNFCSFIHDNTYKYTGNYDEYCNETEKKFAKLLERIMMIKYNIAIDANHYIHSKLYRCHIAYRMKLYGR